MSRTEQLRAELAVAELEDELVALKADGEPDMLRQCKDDLRYVRWVMRGGPAEETAALEAGEHTNRAVAELYQRWLGERG